MCLVVTPDPTKLTRLTMKEIMTLWELITGDRYDNGCFPTKRSYPSMSDYSHNHITGTPYMSLKQLSTLWCFFPSSNCMLFG